MTRKNEAMDFAARITEMGFTVYLAESGVYGFITDDSESRVLSFSFNDQTSLSGNYGPPSATSGTGWRMDEAPSSLTNAESVKAALYAYPPSWSRNGWRYLSTVDQYLKSYAASSKFVRFVKP